MNGVPTTSKAVLLETAIINIEKLHQLFDLSNTVFNSLPDEKKKDHAVEFAELLDTIQLEAIRIKVGVEDGFGKVLE